MGKKEKKTILTFARREGRPSDSIRYKKGRRTPSARMRKVMSRWITKRWRRGEYTSGTYSRRREGESSSGLTIGMFSGFDTGERRGMERKKRKKKEEPRGRVFIGLLCQGYSSVDRRIGTVVIFSVATFYQKLSRAANALIFFLASTQHFFLLLFRFFKRTARVIHGKYDAV